MGYLQASVLYTQSYLTSVCSQAMNIEQLLLGKSALLKIQVTYCGDFQTLLGITVARVVTGMCLLCSHLCMQCHERWSASSKAKC